MGERGADWFGSGWPRVATVGLLGMAVFTLVVMAVNEALIPPVAVFGIVFIVVAVLCIRLGAGRRWPWILAAIAPALFLLISIPFVAEDLEHPESAFGFLPTALSLIVGVVTAVAGVLAAIRSTFSWRPVVGIGAALGIVAVVVSVVGVLGLDSDERQEGDVVVVAEDVEYPEQITVAAGSVAFYVDNKDRIRHTFDIEGVGVSEELPGLTARRVEVDLEPGEYRFFCNVTGHEDMEGTLLVQ
jgi:plastocyanin